MLIKMLLEKCRYTKTCCWKSVVEENIFCWKISEWWNDVLFDQMDHAPGKVTVSSRLGFDMDYIEVRFSHLEWSKNWMKYNGLG